MLEQKKMFGGPFATLSITTLLIVLFSFPAQAGIQDEMRKIHKELVVINQVLNDARKHIFTDISDDNEGQAAAIIMVQDAIKQAGSMIKPSHKGNKKSFKKVQDNVKDIRSWLAGMELVYGCSKSLASSRDLQSNGASATDTLVAATEAANKLRDAGDKWENAATHCTTQIEKIKTADSAVVATAKEDAAVKATQQAAAEQKSKSGRFFEGAKLAIATLQINVTEGKSLDAAALTILSDATQEIVTAQADGAALLQATHSQWRMVAAWSQKDPAAQKFIAKELQGKLVAKGKNKGKSIKVKVKAKSGSCYVMLAHFNDFSNDETITEFSWVTKKPLQAFQFGVHGKSGKSSWGAWRGEGFCTDSKGVVKGGGKLTGANAKKGLRYAVVEISRSSLPLSITGDLQLLVGDHCDTKYWSGLWTNPVPGTLQYVDGEPVLLGIAAGNEANTGTLQYMTLSSPAAVTKDLSKFSSTPTDPIVFKNEYQWPGCPATKEKATAKSSKKILSCYHKVAKKQEKNEKKFAKLRAKFEKKGKPTDKIDAKSEKAAAKIVKAKAKCKTLENKADAKFAEVYATLNQQLIEAKIATGSATLKYQKDLPLLSTETTQK